MSPAHETPPERLLRVKQLFMDALDVPPARRAAFITRECSGDDELRREVLELFLLHGEQDEWLDKPLDGSEAFAEFATPREGFVGPYRLVSELGRGGMAVVHLAERDGQTVALKLLAAGSLSPEMRERFRLEARILRRLDHPGLARVLDVGESPGPGGLSQPWLAMEQVDGKPLLEHASEAELTIQSRLELMVAVCDAVQHAHAHGVVHRDLKPENILVRADGQPVVLDFGVARLLVGDERPTELLTRIGQLVGTPQYMSPEQVQAEPAGVGPASDVYSLGVILYELLSGRVPYEASGVSLHRAVITILTTDPVPLGTATPELQGPLEHIVMMALEKEPRSRFADARALGDDLRRLLDGRKVRARGPSLVRRVRRWSRRRKRVAAAVVVVLGLAALVGAWAVGNRDRVPRERVLATYREAEKLVLEAVPLLYEGERTPERMREAASVLGRARALLNGVPPLSHHDILVRRLEKELGTAQMLLAELGWDALAARQAVASFERALATPFDTVAAHLADRQLEALGSATLSDDEIRGLQAGAHLELHRRWGESRELARCMGLLKRCLADRQQARREPALMPWLSPAMIQERVAYAFNALTEAGSELAWYRGSAEAARQAADWSDSAYAHREAFEQDWPALGSLLFERACAYRALGVLAGSAPALDTALVYLRLCEQLRGEERPQVFAQTQRESARLDVSFARRAREPAARAGFLKNASHTLERTHALLAGGDLIAPQLASIRSQQAEVFIELALATRSRAWLDSADARLAETVSAFPPTSYPRPAAMHWVRTGLAARARLELTGALEAREAYEAAFERARIIGRSRQDSLVLGRVARAAPGH